MQENFKPRTGADRFAGIGTLIFNMIKNKQPMVDGIARHLGVNRNQVVDAEGDIKLMAAYCSYPQAVVAFDLGESVGKDTPPCALC